VFEDVILYDIQ